MDVPWGLPKATLQAVPPTSEILSVNLVTCERLKQKCPGGGGGADLKMERLSQVVEHFPSDKEEPPILARPAAWPAARDRPASHPAKRGRAVRQMSVVRKPNNLASTRRVNLDLSSCLRGHLPGSSLPPRSPHRLFSLAPPAPLILTLTDGAEGTVEDDEQCAGAANIVADGCTHRVHLDSNRGIRLGAVVLTAELAQKRAPQCSTLRCEVTRRAVSKCPKRLIQHLPIGFVEADKDVLRA